MLPGALDDGGAELFRGALAIGDDGVPESYGYLAGNYGTLTPDDYADRGGNTRTILALTYNTSTGVLGLTLQGSVANNDTTFTALILPGGVLLRSAASYSSPSNSIWTWTPGSNYIGTSGTIAAVLV